VDEHSDSEIDDLINRNMMEMLEMEKNIDGMEEM